MKGFVEMQAQINKSYALAKYGVPDVRKLTKEELDALEIEVTVEQGSSIVEINIDGFLTKLTQELVGKMNATEIMFTVLGAAVIWGGVTVFKRFLDNRKDIRLAEIAKDGEKEHLRTMQIMSEQETKRLRVISEMIAENHFSITWTVCRMTLKPKWSNPLCVQITLKLMALLLILKWRKSWLRMLVDVHQK